MSVLKYKEQKITSMSDLISLYGKREFASPYRSTIPLISLFFQNESTLNEIIPDFKSYECVFEYKTPVQKGKGYASCTDLMIFNNEKAFGIEAKRTEPKYQTVQDWLISGNKENRIQVLSGWLDLINRRCKTSLETNNIKSLSYQMIHRFASVCKINGNSELMYFGFSLKSEAENYYKEELKNLADLSKREIPVKLILFDLEETDSFKNLERQWNERSKKTDLSEQVKQLILKEKPIKIKVRNLTDF